MSSLKVCINCGALSEGTRCPSCQQELLRRVSQTRPRDRPTRTNEARWKALSARLRKAQPWCSRCGATADLTVDHVVPLAAGGDPYDVDGLVVLCRRCNSSKGGRR